eukprot:GDKK01071100.1.p1 GENE.GDKK01071100.1~~GDKK01071100.1.p1  ORF type:complete len:184 (-),score=44.83 GDKK01071100.1:27-578(-)
MFEDPRKTLLTIGNVKRVTSIWSNGAEMVEEFDVQSGALLSRRKKAASSPLTGEAKWVWEVGQQPVKEESDLIAVSSANPIFMRIDSSDSFQWRVRNIPYPSETYNIVIDHDDQKIVIKTTNKKYYKRIDVPDLKRVGLVLEDSRLSWTYRQNTLIVSYTKPLLVLEQERASLREAEKSALHN